MSKRLKKVWVVSFACSSDDFDIYSSRIKAITATEEILETYDPYSVKFDDGFVGYYDKKTDERLAIIRRTSIY